MLQKEQCLSAGAQPEIFMTGEGLCGIKGLRCFGLTKIQQKGALHGKILEFFLQDTLKNTF